MAVLLANNATSRLASSLTAAATTLSVTSGEGAKFPSPTGGDWFPLTLIKSSGALEILRCTARSGDVLTVTRAQEGTAAQAFLAGDRVEVRATAGVFDEQKQATAAAQTAADNARTAADNARTAADNAQGSADTAQADVGALEGLAIKKDAATDTGAAKIPAGTEAQRPATPQNGMERYNSDIHDFEYYINGAWVSRTTLTRALNEAPIVTLASASTVNIGAAGANSISVSGTTTITAFDTIASGAIRRLVFQGALTLTHNATSLILPGAANITTAAGDVAEFLSIGSGNWRCINYTKANGESIGASQKQLCTAWVNFNGTGTVAIRDSYNVSSITDDGVGLYTVNFTTPMVNANYSVGGSSSVAAAATNVQFQDATHSYTTNGFSVRTGNNNNTADNAIVSKQVFGGKA